MATINLNSLSPDDKSLNNAESICFSMDFSRLTANLKIIGERRESWYGGRVDTPPLPLTPVD